MRLFVCRGEQHVILGDEPRPLSSADAVFGDYALGDVASRGDVVHDVHHHALDDAAQSPCARVPLKGELGYLAHGFVLKLEVDAIDANELLILLGERVLGLREDVDECVLI